jgi:hypothetical protein
MHTSERVENEYDRVLSRSVGCHREKNILARTTRMQQLGPDDESQISFVVFISLFISLPLKG